MIRCQSSSPCSRRRAARTSTSGRPATTRSQASSTRLQWPGSAATTATPISVRPCRSSWPTSATATSSLRSAATIGRTYERFALSERESGGSNRSNTVVPVYTIHQCVRLCLVSEYAMLLLPSVNRVYADAAVDLAVAELEAFGASVLNGRLRDVAAAPIGGVSYVTFRADGLDARAVAYLSNASAMYALFAVEGELLRPVPLTPLCHFDDDLVTIQKYQGKTNEQFTRLLLNVTLLAAACAPRMLDGPLRVLDPMCGRGTTLNTALIYGYDVAGLDIDGKDFEAYGAFIQTYLKRKKIKHKAVSAPVRRERRTIGRRLQITVAGTRSFELVCADTTRVGEFFRPETFDAVVADAPYGVQHGSRTPARGLARGPLELLREAVPGWARLLRPGGGLGIAWNTYVASRDDAAAVLRAAGLEVVDSGPYRRLRHRVDQAIIRDILVARRPHDLPRSP